jgi:hypothetical protein
VDQGRYLAEHIDGANLAIVPGNDGFIYTEPAGEARHQIEEFLKGLTSVIDPDRVLATILFTDIVGSTERASAMGDRGWLNLRWPRSSHPLRSVDERHPPLRGSRDSRRTAHRGGRSHR